MEMKISSLSVLFILIKQKCKREYSLLITIATILGRLFSHWAGEFPAVGELDDIKIASELEYSGKKERDYFEKKADFECWRKEGW